ncbi:amino acid permease [candidate division KSB1 bacterium]|nr:amino acid permease [candidate division KSB1 bacterium]
MLKRELGLFNVFAISTGAMISSGLFVLPGLAYAQAGPAMILAYLLAAILIIPSMFAKAELASAMPRAGGDYFFIDRSLGPLLGLFGGFANWFSISLKSAFALVGIGAFAILLKPDISSIQIKAIAMSACLFFILLNLFSIKLTGRIQVILVILLLVICFFYIGRGFIATQPERYTPFMPNGFWSVVTTAGLVFVSFGGLTKIASIAEEVKSPARNIPLGMFLSFIVVTSIYILAIGVTVGIVDGQDLHLSLIPLSLGAGKLMGFPGTLILSVGAIAAFFTTANSGLLSASRTPLAMSRDQLLPGWFAKVHPKTSTPILSILFTGGFMMGVILFLSTENLVKTASTLMILLFMMSNVAVIVMRESKIQNYRPHFKVPIYPWMPAFALSAYGFLLIEMGWIPILISVSFFLFGVVIYFGFARKRIKRSSALMHLVKRISAKELKTRSLERELRDIVIERDEIVGDQFDLFVRSAEILDLEASTSADKVFHQISEILEKRLQLDSNTLYQKFMEREHQAYTIVRPGLAIPHIIVPGEDQFDIMLVRCLKGIRFSIADEPVTTLFILVGSMDQRRYHLRALMSIAHIVQEPDFEKRWKAARTTDELRDVLLLSKRKRSDDL